MNTKTDFVTCVKCGTTGLMWAQSVKGKWYLGVPMEHTFEDGNTVTTHIAGHNCQPTPEGLAAYEEQRKEREKAKAELDAKLQAYHDHKASLKHFTGEIGDAITFTGKVIKSICIDGYYGSQMLIIVETENNELAKMFTTANWAYETYENQEVTIKGFIGAFDTYENDPQTLIKRPKLVK